MARTPALKYEAKTSFWSKGGTHSSFVACGPKRPAVSQKLPSDAGTCAVEIDCGLPSVVASVRNVRWRKLEQKCAVASDTTTTMSRVVLPSSLPVSVTKSGTVILPSGQLVCAPLSGFMIRRPSSAVWKSVQAGGVSVEEAEPHLTPVPHGGGRGLPRATICMTPLEPGPEGK